MQQKPYLDEINDLKNTSRHYFAAANTYKGFRSFFDGIFDSRHLDRVYILKGGPGVGKSTLMKKAALSAEKKGFSPIQYHCSSDPKSLDGVLIEELGTAIIDGTAPHTVDPYFAGAKEVIVNLGEAWDLAALRKKSGEIVDISEKKSDCYRTAYRMLSAAKSADDELSDMGRECSDLEKLHFAAGRFASKHLKGAPTGQKKQIVTDAISCDGRVRLFTPEKFSETLYFVKNVKNTASLFFEELMAIAAKQEAQVCVGITPLDPERINCLYFPEISLCVSLYDDDFCKSLEASGRSYKVINTGRFFDSQAYRARRQKYRFTEKCRDALMDEAVKSLEKAGEYHASLEEIYGRATDYKKVSQIGNQVISELKLR